MSIPWHPFEQWLDNVALGALSSRETLRASYDLARLVVENGIPGDFVECGVFGGAQCAAMARAIMEPVHYWEHNKKMAEVTGEQWPPRRIHPIRCSSPASRKLDRKTSNSTVRDSEAGAVGVFASRRQGSSQRVGTAEAELFLNTISGCSRIASRELHSTMLTFPSGVRTPA